MQNRKLLNWPFIAVYFRIPPPIKLHKTQDLSDNISFFSPQDDEQKQFSWVKDMMDVVALKLY